MNLTNLAPGQFAVAAAWSPDGGTLAVLRKTTIRTWTPSSEAPGTPAELWLRTLGRSRRIDGVVLPDPLDGYVEHWSVGTLVARWQRASRSRRETCALRMRRRSIRMSSPGDGSAPIVLRDRTIRGLVAGRHGTRVRALVRAAPRRPRPGLRGATIEVIGAHRGRLGRQIVVPSGDPRPAIALRLACRRTETRPPMTYRFAFRAAFR